MATTQEEALDELGYGGRVFYPNDLRRMAGRFSLGDTVDIPQFLGWDGGLATVQQICTNHIVFRSKRTGQLRSYSNYDCLFIQTVVKCSQMCTDSD